MTEINLSQYNILRPTKIIWIVPQELITSDTALDLVKSKSQRKFLRNIDQILINSNIRWESAVLDKQKFLEWLPYCEVRMRENDYRVIANETWYDTCIEANKQSVIDYTPQGD